MLCTVKIVYLIYVIKEVRTCKNVSYKKNTMLTGVDRSDKHFELDELISENHFIKSFI